MRRSPRFLLAVPLLAVGLVFAAEAPLGELITGPKQSAADAAAAAKAAKEGKAATPAAPAATPVLPPPALPQALYLTWQHDPTTTMTVMWHTVWTEAFADSALEFRTDTKDEKAPWTRAQGRAVAFPFTDRMVHTVELTQLTPDTTYQFRLGRLRMKDEMSKTELQFEPHDKVQKFRTLPAALSRPVRFLEGGDVYGGGLTNDETFSKLCKVGAKLDPDFALLGGDIAYANDEPKAAGRWGDFLKIWTDTMATKDGRLIPVVPAIGNHEVHGDSYQTRGGAPHRGMSTDRAILFYTAFAFPGRPGYNVLDVGNYLSLISLDSYHTNPVAGAQTDWLRATLAKRGQVPYVIPFYHVPAYPSTRSFDGAVSVAIRENWCPLFDAAGVRFVFEHHDHTYKRTKPIKGNRLDATGTRYLGDGAWGVTKRETHELEKASFLDFAEGRNHVFVVTLTPARAEFVAVDPEGVEFDKFTIDPKRP